MIKKKYLNKPNFNFMLYFTKIGFNMGTCIVFTLFFELICIIKATDANECTDNDSKINENRNTIKRSLRRDKQYQHLNRTYGMHNASGVQNDQNECGNINKPSPQFLSPTPNPSTGNCTTHDVIYLNGPVTGVINFNFPKREELCNENLNAELAAKLSFPLRSFIDLALQNQNSKSETATQNKRTSVAKPAASEANAQTDSFKKNTKADSNKCKYDKQFASDNNDNEEEQSLNDVEKHYINEIYHYNKDGNSIEVNVFKNE